MNRYQDLGANGRFWAAVFLLVIFVAAACSPAHGAQDHKQILLLNSYHQDFIWNESISRGLFEVLRPKEMGINLHVENMDTKRVTFDKHYAEQLRDVYAHKYRDVKLDLIMLADNNAFDFMRSYHEELFPGVPVVFCGINFYRPEMIRDHPLFTGVAENVDAKGTLWWALKIHPDTKQVYVINDHSPTGKAITRTIKEQLQDFAPGVSIRYSANIPLPDLYREVKGLPEDSLVLFGVYHRDNLGHFHDVGEVVNAVSKATAVPVYGLVDIDLGHGIVGGMLSSGHFQGQAMAQIALHVLAGNKPKDIPVITEGLSRPMFDYRELKRHNIDLSALPEESEIINRPPSIYNQDMKYIWMGVAFTVIQMVIILVLMANRARRRQAEKELRSAHQLLEERVRDRTSELKESEEAMRTIFDASHDAIFIHGVGGNILDANERMLGMYGLTRKELSEISIAKDLSSRNNAVYRLSSLWRSVVNGEPQYFEWKARRPHDGSEFDAEIYLNRIVYRGQEAILANVRDITVRKESENRIRQSLSKFEAILENSLMGIAMSRGRRFSTINRRGAEIFGYSPGELIGNKLSMILSTEVEEEAFVRHARDTLSKRGEFNTEQAFRNKQGDKIWCRMYGKAVDPGSLGKGVIWAWDDITDHRRNQEDLVRTREDAEAANRAKSEFLAAMSHEIRTPMNAIVGMTDILLQTDLNSDQRDYLRTVMDSAQHLLSIINDILDLSKIEARKLVLDRTDFDLPFHVRTTIKGLEVQGRQKDLDMVLEIDKGLHTCVKGDPLSLRQVLMNLVGNAIKFTHRGTIAIRVKPAPDAPSRDPEDPRTIGILFEVEDTGIGIPEEFMDSIFQSFSQTTRAFGGTGLGLAICKQLIALMGGDINVTSKVGRGSVFSFVVRFEPGFSCPLPVAPRAAVPEAPTRPIHLLVAEDNDVNVMVTTLRLEEMGYSYSVAANGLEVLDLLKRERFDLVLMDIEMPVLDGISTTKAIRLANPGHPIPNPSIPIVGVTAHALKEFREKSIDAGMNDYVSKPVDFNELALIINRLVGATPEHAAPVQPAVPRSAPAGSIRPEPPPEGEELPVWSPDKAMQDLGADESLFADFTATARTELALIMTEIGQALDAGDPMSAAKLARTAKSICSAVGAHAAALTAADLESACREKKGTEIYRTRLGEEVEELLIMMRSL
ncbi:PAS domain S-box protein [Pseudodesulfovibrio cashew]|uniref:Sensory/regulatory protein RpfC n=1 Tax=Pseudodesulfovibrio cashew TaxID=2678688 RepID=A0A6I6JGA2_9BACT|nr:PAS domain S-box protein [Pseudodesulfovibrio cashew]QGY39533.1 PAS domain S-box protein [Pseudodesulfovibrio cashew]